MTHPAMHHESSSIDIGGMIEADPDEFGRLMGPLMAGARARGVADAFEMMGLAAILIDESGRVLYAGGRAERALLPMIQIAERHLVGADAQSNARLQTLIESALRAGSDSPSLPEVEVSDAEGRPRLSMRAVRFSRDGSPGPQLLHAVIVVTEIAV